MGRALVFKEEAGFQKHGTGQGDEGHKASGPVQGLLQQRPGQWRNGNEDPAGSHHENPQAISLLAFEQILNQGLSEYETTATDSLYHPEQQEPRVLGGKQATCG